MFLLSVMCLHAPCVCVVMYNSILKSPVLNAMERRLSAHTHLSSPNSIWWHCLRTSVILGQTRLSYPATCQTGRHALYTSTPPSAVTPSPWPCDFHHILRSVRSTQGITLPLCQSSDSESTIIFLYSRTRKANADDADLLTFSHRICRPLTVW